MSYQEPSVCTTCGLTMSMFHPNHSAECVAMITGGLAQAVHEDEINEIVWQALICAYLDHPGWRTAAEAVFEKHGYTAEEIRRRNALNDGSTRNEENQ